MQRSQRRCHCWKHWNLQRKCCQGPPEILVEPLQHQQNASLSNPHSSLGTKKKGPRKRDRASRGWGGHNHHFVFFSQKGGVLLTLQRFNENSWWPLTALPLKILDNVSSGVSGADIAASSHWGSALKGTRVSILYDYYEYIFFNNSGNFWVPIRTQYSI